MGVGGSVDQWVVERADISLLMDPEGVPWESPLMDIEGGKRGGPLMEPGWGP